MFKSKHYRRSQEQNVKFGLVKAEKLPDSALRTGCKRASPLTRNRRTAFGKWVREFNHEIEIWDHEIDVEVSRYLASLKHSNAHVKLTNWEIYWQCTERILDDKLFQELLHWRGHYNWVTKCHWQRTN